jgi:hypothetical protein
MMPAPDRPATRDLSRSLGAAIVRVFAGVVIASGCASPLVAQQYGQWTWTASLGAGSRGVTSKTEGVTSEDWRVDDLRVFAGVNGFIAHPTIAAFELGGDLSVQSETNGFDQDRNGYLGRLRILPQSSVPVEVHASRTSFGYRVPDGSGLRLGAADSITSLGGTVRVRKGLFSGLMAGFERNATEFAAPEPRSGDRWEHAFANWSGESGGIRHLVLVDQRSTEYGDLGYRYDELSVTVDERGEIGDRWNWNAVGSGFVRDYDYDAGLNGSTTLLRLRGNATRTYASERLLTLRYDGGSTSAEDADTTWTQRLFADMRVPVGTAWTVSPYAGVNYIATDLASATIPQVGVAGAWNGSVRNVSLDVNGALGVLVFDESVEHGGESYDVDGTEVAGSIGIVIARTGAGGVTQRLELAASRNEFSSAGEPIPGLPDLGFRVAPTGFQDSGRARFSVARNLEARRLSLWAEYGVRRFEQEALDGTSGTGTISDLLLTAQLNTPRAQLLFSGGATEVDSAGSLQNVDYYSGSLAFRATRNLSLIATWLHSRQDVDLAPDITIERLDAGAELAVGLVRLGARSSFTREQRQDALAFDSTALEIYVRRDFGGLLPIVSAPPRRGVIK